MSHNRNPQGRNQHNECARADDPRLIEALNSYHHAGKTNNKEISELLEKDWGIHMGDSTVKRRRRELGLYGSSVTTRTMPYFDKAQLVLNQLEEDVTSGRGLDNIRRRIAFDHGIHLTRDFISDIMHAIDEDGFSKREPNAKKIHRSRKNPVGIHERWSGDGHDKLNSIGFPIWAVVDDATSKWLGAWIVPNNRLGVVVAYLYLCLVEKFGGVPLQFTTDCGSETTQAFGLGKALREMFYPEIDSQAMPPHIYARSVHNIAIERSWLRLRLDWGNNAVKVFNNGISAGLYNPADPNQYQLCQWLWPKLLQ